MSYYLSAIAALIHYPQSDPLKLTS